VRGRITRILVSLLSGTVVALGLGVGTAHASPGDLAHVDCQQGFGPALFSSVSFSVPGNTRLQLVPLPDLEPGDVLRVTAFGTISTGGWSGSHGPDGNLNDPAPGGLGSLWPAPGLNKYSLYGTWGRNGFIFKAGSDSGCVDYTTQFGTGPDTVFLGVNDENLSDNTGSFNVNVRVWRNPSVLRDGGFEQQASRTVSAPWTTEGPDFKGIDIGLNLSHTGRNNAFIRTPSTNWNALTQRVSVTAFTPYRMQGWVRTSGNFNAGFFGVRPGNSNTPMAETRYGSFTLAGYQQLTVDFNTGPNTSLTAFVGYWAPGYDSWIQIDDLAVWPV
jgi:hypothetical protein